MASIMTNSLRSGKRAQDAQGSDQHLSKIVELNGKYRLFFKKYSTEEGEDIAAAMVPGRLCDKDICGTTFIPYSSDMYDVEESGEITDKTGMQAWARMSKVLYDAQCSREKKNKELEAQRTAEELGQSIDATSLSRALEAIELNYYGGEAANGERINPTKQPAVSNLKTKMSTRLCVVKILPNGAPDWKNVKYAVLELSKSRQNELITILDDPNYCIPECDYLEVGYDYVGADKQSAGRNAKLQAIAPSLSLATTDPTGWEQFGKKAVEAIAPSESLDKIAEFMKSRNRNFKGTKGPSDAISAIKTYCAKNAAIFASIDFTDDHVAWTAQDFLDAHLVDSLPKIKTQFEALAAQNKKAEEASAPTAPTTPEEVGETLAQATDAVAAAAAEAAAEQAALNMTMQVANSGVAQTIKSAMTSMPDLDLADELGDEI